MLKNGFVLPARTLSCAQRCPGARVFRSWTKPKTEGSLGGGHSSGVHNAHKWASGGFQVSKWKKNILGHLFFFCTNNSFLILKSLWIWITPVWIIGELLVNGYYSNVKENLQIHSNQWNFQSKNNLWISRCRVSCSLSLEVACLELRSSCYEAMLFRACHTQKCKAGFNIARW